MEIGPRLKELRKQKKMTLKDVGDYLSLTGVAVSGYEKGNRNPSAEIIEKLADLYEVSVDDIYGRQTDNSNMRTILNNKTLHWDGEPLRDDELNVIRQLLELRIRDKREARKTLTNDHII